MPSSPYVTIAQAAEARQVSARTIRRWISTGRLPAYRTGPRLIRINPADLSRLDRPVTCLGVPGAGGAAA